MMIEWSKHVGSIFESFNVNNLSVCIGWCADQVTLRSAPCNDKEEEHNLIRVQTIEACIV